MNICEENSTFIKCYKAEQKLFDNLYIEHYPDNPMVILWNKYQLFVYENNNFETATKVYIPEYQVISILFTKNYLLCLDSNGYVHVSALKLKNPAQKQLKCAFEPKDQGVITCVRFGDEHSLSLKYEFGKFTLRLSKISTNFKLEKKFTLSPHGDLLPPSSQDKCTLTHHKVNEQNFLWLEKVLGLKQILTGSNNHLVVLSCDGLNVFACIIDPNSIEDEVTVRKLCTCPSEICNISVKETRILISLKMGTIMSFKSDELPKKPDIIHLNTALHKLSVLNEGLIYTDGASMWHAANIFTDINFKQLLVNNVNDFINYEDRILCTTFSKLIYTIAYDSEKTYLNSCNDYLPAEKLLSNSDYLNKIFHEVEKSENLAMKCTEEDLYITALSVLRRPDIVNNLIQSSVTVYENYEEITKENMKLLLTEDVSKCFVKGVFLFLVRIIFDDVKEVSAVLKNIIADIDTMIHITLSTEQKILKTTSIKIEEPFTKANYLIPLQLDPSTDVNINIKLVTKIPGAHDMKQFIWAVLYKNSIVLKSERFIHIRDKSHSNLKDFKESIEELILKSCANQCGNIFDVTEVSKHCTQHSMYIALPENFKQNFLNSKGYLSKYLCESTANFLMQQFKSDEFLQSKGDVNFYIGKEKVTLQIENDGISNPQLKVTSDNNMITLDIRNFLSNMIYGDNDRERVEFISNSFYTTVENIQKAFKTCVTVPTDFEEYIPLVNQFEKNVIGMLPL